jgi:hypothetical protein
VKPLELLVTEKQNGAAILLGDLIGWVHQFLTANKDEIYRCENSKSTELDDDIKFHSVDPAEFDSANEDEDQPTEPNHFHER